MDAQKGRCPHGEFVLTEGCPQCIAERQARESNPNIVSVRYISETSGESSARGYVYFSVDRLQVGDIVQVPVRDTTRKAEVTAVDVPVTKIAAFIDKVKTIPAGSKIVRRTAGEPMKTGDYAGFGQDGKLHPTVDGEPEPVAAIPEDVSGGDEVPPGTIRLSDKPGQSEQTVVMVRIKPDLDPRVQALAKEVLNIQVIAGKATIASVQDVQLVASDLKLMGSLKKQVIAVQKEYLDPIKQHVADVTESFKSLLDALALAEIDIKGKIKVYDAKVAAEAAEAERINRLRMEAARAEMELKGELTESVGLVDEPPPPPKHYRGELGMVGKVDHWKVKVVNIKLLPPEYLMANQVLLNSVVKSGLREISGCEIWNDPDIRVS